MMTTKQISLVKSTWKLLRKVDPVLLGDVFYSKLFHEAPQTRALFTTSQSDQSRKLIDMLNMIVARLDQQGSFDKELRALGERHTRYGVKPHHYETVGHALLWTIQQGLGKDWNDEVQDAWTTCYSTIADAMQG